MKKIIFTFLITACLASAVFAQSADSRNWFMHWYAAQKNPVRNWNYEVKPRYTHPVKKSALQHAGVIGDFMEGYPANWIKEYVSVEILATCNHKCMSALGKDDGLTPVQLNLLNNADISSDIVINIKYRYKNGITGWAENGHMQFTMMVVPEVEARYEGGNMQLRKYVQENCLDKIYEMFPAVIKLPVIQFTINERGDVVNAKISGTSGDAKADQLLLEAIQKMPRWKPALDLKGNKVKQEFELSDGGGGDGC